MLFDLTFVFRAQVYQFFVFAVIVNSSLSSSTRFLSLVDAFDKSTQSVNR